MATLPINSAAATPTLLESFRHASRSLIVTSSQIGSTTASRSLNDSVTLSKKATRQLNITKSSPELDPPKLFTSYFDALQQQILAQAMIKQALSGTGNNSAGQTSVTDCYQTLHFQQSIYALMFNLKGDVFQSILNITV